MSGMSTLSAPGKAEVAELGPVRATDAEAGRATLRRLLRLRWGVAAAVVLLLIVLSAVLAPWISPHDPLAVNIRHRLAPPAWMEHGSSDHLLGTDQVGRDLLSRMNLTSDTMAFSEEIKLEAFSLPGTRCKELVIYYKERHGESKLNIWRDGFANLAFIFKKRFGMLERVEPLIPRAEKTANQLAASQD